MSSEEEFVCYSEIISRTFSAVTEESLSQDKRFPDPRVELETSVLVPQRYACLIVSSYGINGISENVFLQVIFGRILRIFL
jgi:hypothetical protein